MRRRELPGGIAPPTKTELKRRAQAVETLATRLIAAPPGVVASLGLPDKLRDAIALARRITGGGALARQRQYVAKLMRGLELAPIEAALASEASAARRQAARFRRAERWRDRLVEEGAAAVAEFATEFALVGHELEQIVAAARAERKRGRPAGAGRRLFRLVEDALGPRR